MGRSQVRFSCVEGYVLEQGKNKTMTRAGNTTTRYGAGRRADLDNIYFRSRWEANYARCLNFLKKHKEIFKWQYEPDTFWFHKIKRGVRSYKPDFKVWDHKNEDPYYYELKGYLDPKSKTKLKRMRIYYPDVKVILVDSKAYLHTAQWKRLIPGWEDESKRRGYRKR